MIPSCFLAERCIPHPFNSVIIGNPLQEKKTLGEINALDGFIVKSTNLLPGAFYAGIFRE